MRTNKGTTVTVDMAATGGELLTCNPSLEAEGYQERACGAPATSSCDARGLEKTDPSLASFFRLRSNPLT